MLEKPWSTRVRVYVFGVLVLPLIAGTAEALRVAGSDSDGNGVLLSA